MCLLDSKETTKWGLCAVTVKTFPCFSIALWGSKRPTAEKLDGGRLLYPHICRRITTIFLTLVQWLDQFSKDHYEEYLRGWLGRMLFSKEEALKKAAVLSGGEKVRCMLARMMLQGGNFLILDEPTNHLDSAMAEWLEEFLQKTKNALIMITHDRYFLDSVVNRIVEIDKGKLYSYPCSYLEYVERKAQREDIAQALAAR